MNFTALATLIVSVTVIAGVIVLMALSKLDTSTGIALIGVLSGTHVGASVATNAAASANTTSSTPPIQ